MILLVAVKRENLPLEKVLQKQKAQKQKAQKQKAQKAKRQESVSNRKQYTLEDLKWDDLPPTK